MDPYGFRDLGLGYEDNLDMHLKRHPCRNPFSIIGVICLVSLTKTLWQCAGVTVLQQVSKDTYSTATKTGTLTISCRIPRKSRLLRRCRPLSGLRRFPSGKVEPSVAKLHLRLQVRSLEV